MRCLRSLGYNFKQGVKGIFRNSIMSTASVLVLLSCVILLTNTHTRRKYYISNYVAVGVYSVATFGLLAWAHQQIEAFAVQYMTTINFEELKVFSEMRGTPYLDNTNMLDLHRGVFALAILSVLALLGNAIWKIVLMRSEKKLIEAGEEATV